MDLLQSIANGLVITMRALTKALTGFIIVPLSIVINNVKPNWEESPRVIKFITGIILIPTTAFLMFAAPWWDDFDIID